MPEQTATTPLYIVSLNGQGDTEIKVITKEQWDYLHSPPPKFINGGATERPSFLSPNDDDIHVTSGSYENDRALQLKGFKEFEFQTDLLSWLFSPEAGPYYVVDEYNGYIY